MVIQSTPAAQAFFALQLTGGFGFALILFSAWLSRVQRHGTWFSFCASWPVFCISFSLLFLAGQQGTTPGRSLCIVQSALVYAAPPLTGSTTFSLVFHLLLDIRHALASTPDKKRRRLVAALLIVPWIIWLAFFLGILVFGFRHPELVRKSTNQTYCVITNTVLPKPTSGWAAFASLGIICLEVVIARDLYHHRTILRGFSGQSTAMAIRVAIFIFLCISAIVVSCVYTATRRRGVEFDVLISSIPPAAAIIFGTQIEIFRGWMFWRRDAADTETSSIPSTLTTLSTVHGTISAAQNSNSGSEV